MTDRVNNMASFDDPHKLSVEIVYVLINGEIILEKGKYYSKKLVGKVLRRD